MKIKNLFLYCCISTFGLAMNAQADIVTFDSLSHIDDLTTDHGASYTENGFLFTNIATEEGSGFSPSLATFGAMVTVDQAPYGYYSGSTALFNNNNEGVTVLSRVDGNAFSFNSIDLAELSPYDDSAYAFDVTFNGLFADGSSVFQTVTLDNLTGVQNYTFSAFSNVVSVNWAQGGYDFHQFDNVNAAPVPVPAAAWLLGSGLIGLLGARKKDRK
jgi:hypothetical protein